VSDQIKADLSDLLVTPVDKVVARNYECSLPPHLWVFNNDPFMLPHINSWLVGACHGGIWGWWGPVSEATAKYSTQIFAAIGNRTPAMPSTWAERARCGTRHAHAGLGAVSVGALELAIWDLLGQYNKRPTWALLKNSTERRFISSYASCLGYDFRAVNAQKIAQQILERGWLIQKWKPGTGLDGAQTMVSLIESIASEGGQVALDFFGAWERDLVVEYFDAMNANCAWIEEPIPPWQLMDISVLENLSGPIAAGEHCYCPQDMLLLSLAGINIWQPDSVFCGGFSALRDCIQLAKKHRARVIPHGGGLLAAVHAAALEPSLELVEWHLSIEPRRQAHLSAPILPAVELAIPTAPGWGGPLVPELRLE
jgi:L-alanine-DL-glutamate epimerase-like enolase superfamily enzyme